MGGFLKVGVFHAFCLLLSVGGMQPIFAQTTESDVTRVRLVPDKKDGYLTWADAQARIEGQLSTNEDALRKHVQIFGKAMNQLDLLVRDIRSKEDGVHFASKDIKGAFGPQGTFSEARQGAILAHFDTAYKALEKISIIRGDLAKELRATFTLASNRLDSSQLFLPGKDVTLEMALDTIEGQRIRKAVFLGEGLKGLSRPVQPIEKMRLLLPFLYDARTDMQGTLEKKYGYGSSATGYVMPLDGLLHQAQTLAKGGVELRGDYKPKFAFGEFNTSTPEGQQRKSAAVNKQAFEFGTALKRARVSAQPGKPLVLLLGTFGFAAVANAGEAKSAVPDGEERESTRLLNAEEDRSWAREARNRKQPTSR